MHKAIHISHDNQNIIDQIWVIFRYCLSAPLHTIIVGGGEGGEILVSTYSVGSTISKTKIKPLTLVYFSPHEGSLILKSSGFLVLSWPHTNCTNDVVVYLSVLVCTCHLRVHMNLCLYWEEQHKDFGVFLWLYALSTLDTR